MRSRPKPPPETRRLLDRMWVYVHGRRQDFFISAHPFWGPIWTEKEGASHMRLLSPGEVSGALGSVWSKYSNAQRFSSLHLSKGCLNPPSWSDTYSSSAEGVAMDWKTMLSYISGSVDEELLLRNEYLVAENRVLRNQL